MELDRDGCFIRDAAVTEVQCDEIISYLPDCATAGSRDMLAHGWCTDLAEQIRNCLSVEIPELHRLKAIQCTLFQKKADRNWLVPWHQDRSLPVTYKREYVAENRVRKKEGVSLYQPAVTVLEKVLAVRLHLDANIESNGPLRVMPGSHTAGIFSIEGLKRVHLNYIPQTILAKKGSLFCLRPLLVHASSKITTDQPRRVLHFVYA